jgi:AcrR family transcriptional regulator
MPPEPARRPAPTLRERKNRLVCEHIQGVALDLFDAQGFDAVTVEDVAAAAGVAASTVYRHFGTKDRLITHDEDDQPMVEALLAAVGEGQTPVAAARAVLAGVAAAWTDAQWQALARRVRHMIDQPSVHAAFVIETGAVADQLAEGLIASAAPAGAAGEDETDLVIAAHALVGAVATAVHLWRRGEFGQPFPELLGRCLDRLEHGLR